MSDSEQVMSIWTIYDHPDDWPTQFVLRRYAVFRGSHWPTSEVYGCDDIEPLRSHMDQLGLFCLGRSPEDHPNVVESWV